MSFVVYQVVSILPSLTVLVHQAIGDKLKCLFVDTGLMRMNERQSIKKLFSENFNIQLDIVNSSNIFLNKERERERKTLRKKEK